MTKRHRFRHHPLHAYKGLMLGAEEEYVGGVQLDIRDAAILAAVDQDDTSWRTLSLAAALPPAAAIAAILDVQVNDGGSAGEDCHMRIAKAGIIIAGRTHYIPCQYVNDMIGSKTVIVELTEDFLIAYMIQASGAVFDYNINLIGWILDPSVTRDAVPSEDLKATFFINP